MFDAGTNIPTITAACLASLVEMVEALTIVLAVGIVYGTKTTVTGAIGGLLVLSLIVGFASKLLVALHIPLPLLLGIAGGFLLWFGLKWLRKAILRAAGKIPLHDEGKIFAREVDQLTASGGHKASTIDKAGALVSFNGVFVEGLEVVMIVVAVGTTPLRLKAAVLGALAALMLVIVAGVLLRTPLTKVPENTLKLIVGIMVAALGTVWLGEAFRIGVAMSSWASLSVAAVYLLVSLIAITLIKRKPSEA